MAERRSVSSRRRPEGRSSRLGAGLHPARVELCVGTTATVRLFDGAVHHVEIAHDVEPAFVQECLRHSRTVLVADGAAGPLLLGALQTSRSVSRDVEGVLEIEARDIRIRAERTLALEVGATAVRAEENGTIRLEGDRMHVDISSVVRFLSARVEFP